MSGEIIGNFDVAQVTLYVFWIFFAGLIVYLHREGKREGFPLQPDHGEYGGPTEGWPAMPTPKTFLMRDGSTVSVPGDNGDKRAIAARQTAPWPGSPIEPTGDPLVDGVGPAAWAERADHPDLTFEGHVKIVPLRAAPGFSVNANDTSPVGMTVVAADGASVGTVKDLWVDKAEMMIRFYEVSTGGEMGRSIMVPESFVQLGGGKVKVNAITGAQFANVPGLANPDQITMLEEERVMAYFGGGLLYATPDRKEPWL